MTLQKTQHMLEQTLKKWPVCIVGFETRGRFNEMPLFYTYLYIAFTSIENENYTYLYIAFTNIEKWYIDVFPSLSIWKYPRPNKKKKYLYLG